MLLYSDGRMSRGNISFALPDGFYFNGINEECTYESMICFFKNVDDSEIRVDVCIYQDEASAQKYTEEWFNEDYEYRYFTPISPVELGGLHGFHAMYASSITGRSNEYYACFVENDLPGDDHHMLEFHIDSNNLSIQKVMQIPEIQKMLSSIKAEAPNA